MARMTTSRDVARLARVSQSTVSRVLSGKGNVRQETSERVMTAAQRLGYYVNETARSMKTKKSKSIGVVLPSLLNPFFSETAHSVYTYTKEHDRTMLIELTMDNPRAHQAVVKDLIGRRVEGLLLGAVSTGDTFMEEYCQHPVVPSVMYNRRLSKDIGNWVVSDNKLGSIMATTYLLTQGHRDILYVSGDMAYSTAVDRLMGYKFAMDNAGKKPRVVCGNYDYVQTFEVVGNVLDAEHFRQPTAIFAGNDLMALAVIGALTNRNLGPKSDIAVIGFDNISWPARRDINLTTISQRQDLMLKTALEGLFDLINGRTHTVRTVIKPELIIRGTA